MSGLALVKEAAPVPRLAYHACPLCDSADFIELATADCSRHALYSPIIPAKMRWMVCRSCDHVFTDGYFGAEHWAELLKRAKPQQLPGTQNMEAARSVAGRIVERISAHAKPGKWLDIGFGDGSLLMVAQEFGYDPIGIDYRPQAVEKLNAMGIFALQGDFRQRKITDCAVISMADVLEHMEFPAECLQEVHGRLNPDGILFVSCPNMDSAAWRELTRVHANPYWIEIEHFHQFTRKRLVKLLKDCGFEPISTAISERYRLGIEIIARKAWMVGLAPAAELAVSQRNAREARRLALRLYLRYLRLYFVKLALQIRVARLRIACEFSRRFSDLLGDIHGRLPF